MKGIRVSSRFLEAVLYWYLLQSLCFPFSIAHVSQGRSRGRGGVHHRRWPTLEYNYFIFSTAVLRFLDLSSPASNLLTAGKRRRRNIRYHPRLRTIPFFFASTLPPLSSTLRFPFMSLPSKSSYPSIKSFKPPLHSLQFSCRQRPATRRYSHTEGFHRPRLNAVC